MPYPNEHSCRLQNPDKFVRFRRDNSVQPNRIFGFKKGKGSAVQAFRYPKSKWTTARAHQHCEDAGGDYTEAVHLPDLPDVELVYTHRQLHDTWEGRAEQAEAHTMVVQEYMDRGLEHFEEDALDHLGIPGAWLPEALVEDIRKEGNKWVIWSQNGKKLGEFDSKEDAVKRLRQIEFFKRHK